MALNEESQKALDRLATYYDGQRPYNPSTNPGGMQLGGHRINFVPALKDLATLIKAIADILTGVGSITEMRDRIGALEALRPTTNGNLTAKGNNADSALLLVDDVGVIGVGADYSGVRLTAKVGKTVHYWNKSGNNIRVYPTASGTIYGYNQDEPLVLASDQMVSFVCISPVDFRAL